MHFLRNCYTKSHDKHAKPTATLSEGCPVEFFPTREFEAFGKTLTEALLISGQETNPEEEAISTVSSATRKVAQTLVREADLKFSMRGRASVGSPNREKIKQRFLAGATNVTCSKQFLNEVVASIFASAKAEQIKKSVDTLTGHLWACFVCPVEGSDKMLSNHLSLYCFATVEDKHYAVWCEKKCHYSEAETDNLRVVECCLPDRNLVLAIIQSQIGGGTASSIARRLQNSFESTFGAKWGCWVVPSDYSEVSNCYLDACNQLVQVQNGALCVSLVKLSNVPARPVKPVKPTKPLLKPATTSNGYTTMETRGFEIKDCFLQDKKLVLSVVEREVGSGSASEIAKRMSRTFETKFGGQWDCFLTHLSSKSVSSLYTMNSANRLVRAVNQNAELCLIKVYGENEQAVVVEGTQDFEIKESFLPDSDQVRSVIQRVIDSGGAGEIAAQLSDAFKAEFEGRWDCFLISRKSRAISNTLYDRSDRCVHALNSKFSLYLLKVPGKSDYTVEDTRGLVMKNCFLPDTDQVLHTIQSKVGCGSANEITKRLSDAFANKFGGRWDCFLINLSLTTVSSGCHYP